MAISKAKLEADLAKIDSLDKSDVEKEILRDAIQSQIDERTDEVAPVEPAPEVPAEEPAPTPGEPSPEVPAEEPAPEIPSEPSPEIPVEPLPETPIDEPAPEVPAEPLPEVPETPVGAPAPVPAEPEAKAQWPSDDDIKLAAETGGELLSAMDDRILDVYAAKKLGK